MNKEIPTIIIGLGGIGSEIVARVEKQMRYESGARRSERYKRGNVRFVIADTDINSIREREKAGYGGYSVRLSGNISVSHCLEKDETAKVQWFPDNKAYYRKSVAEGAGQIRSISRLALHHAIKNGMLQPLYDAINDLFMNGGNLCDQEMKIAIVSTIAGGTGSGSLLPLGIHIKDYLNRTYSGSGAKINGFLILPEVLHDVIPSKEERRNLNANSYAAVEEIDALINGSVKPQLSLPNEEDNENKEFGEAPFDFCFLFGRLSNQKTVYGNIEDYKEVIARCLQTQFVGTLAAQYLSKEDNVLSSSLRTVGIGECHYERFASAGCSILRYPLAEIEEYLSLRWMSDVMQKEWVKYDERRRWLREIKREKRERGEEIGTDTPRDDFLDAVEEVDKQQKGNNRELLSCFDIWQQIQQENGNRDLLDKLSEYIEMRFEEKKSSIRAQIEDGYNIILTPRANYIKRQKKQYIAQHVLDYTKYEEEIKAEYEKLDTSLGSSIEREICRPHMGDTEAYYVEHYIKNKKGEFMSPNFIRYYLYKLEKDAETLKIQLENDIESAMESIDQQLKEGKNIPNEKVSIKQQVEKIKIYHSAYVEMETAAKNRLKNHCISELLKYIRKISGNYERFFEEYSQLLVMAKQRQEEMERRFDVSVLKTEHWVYANNEHLQVMLDEMKTDSRYYTIGGSVSRWLYSESANRDNADNRDNIANEYEHVKAMWREQFDTCFNDKFDINVLTALEKEGRTKKGEEYISYMRERLNDVRNNASILLSACRRPDILMRKYCVYPKKLLQTANCSEIIKEFLNNGMAFCDSRGLDVDDKQIVFFEVGYGFLPSDIDFFADDSGMCADYPVGSGAQSYKWTKKNICKENVDAEITPHIDRRWHRDEYLNVSWEIRAYTFYMTKILWIMYIKAQNAEPMKTVTNAEDIKKMKEDFWKQFEQYYGQNEEKIQQEIMQVNQKELKELNDKWKSSKNEEDMKSTCKAMVQRVYQMQEIIVEKWCHSRKGKTYLKEKLKEDFFRMLNEFDEVSDEWKTVYNEEWNNFEKENGKE